jgi:hypothetical protein
MKLYPYKIVEKEGKAYIQVKFKVSRLSSLSNVNRDKTKYSLLRKFQP